MFTSIDTNASKSTLKKPVNFRIPKMKRCVEPKKQETFHYEPMPFRSKKLDPVNIPIQNHNTILRLSIDTGAWISVLYPNKLNGYTTIDVNKSINIKGIVQNTSIKSEGVIIAEIFHEDLIIPHEFHIIKNDPNSVIDGILGHNFFIKYNAALDYKHNSLE